MHMIGADISEVPPALLTCPVILYVVSGAKPDNVIFVIADANTLTNAGGMGWSFAKKLL